MTKARAIIFFVLCVFVSFSQPAWSQDQNAAPPANATVTPDQARQAVDILQDDNKRNQLIQTLQTIAKASPAPAASNTSAVPPAGSGDNLGVQLLAQVSNWFGDVSDELAHAARSVSDFPKTWHWLLQQASDPAARAAAGHGVEAGAGHSACLRSRMGHAVCGSQAAACGQSLRPDPRAPSRRSSGRRERSLFGG
jgi:hypothetical protein